MTPSDIIAIIAVVVSIISATAAILSTAIARQTIEVNKRISKRQGIVDLHLYWSDVQDIDPANINPLAVIKAANALELTASLWNNEVMDEVILYQSYWEPYRRIYDTLNGIHAVIPVVNKTGDRLLTREMTKAYDGMRKLDLSTVLPSK